MPSHPTSVFSVCQQCGRWFEHTVYERKRKYCSNRCVGDANHTQAVGGGEERFWAQVRKGTDDVGECWIWTGYVHPDSYGRIGIGGKIWSTHRLVWTLVHGEIPNGLDVLHSCPDGDRGDCVNPAHLRLGTDIDNARDRVERGRQAHGDRSGARTHPERTARGERASKAKLTDDKVLSIRNQYAGGRTLDGLAEAFDVTKHQIWMIVQRRNWTHLAPTVAEIGAEGQRRRPGRAQLTEDQVREIRRRHSEGDEAQQLADQFTVTVDNIRAIVKRISWKHVD